MYIQQGLYPSALLYAGLTVFCIFGYVGWRRAAAVLVAA